MHIVKSPFPGLDPYLQSIWGEVHHSLMGHLKNQIQSQLPEGLWARAEETVTVDLGWQAGSEHYRPDVSVIDHSELGDSPVEASGSGATVAVAEPAVVIDAELEITERHIEIVDTRSDRRVVTVIEVISPTNKLSRSGRDKYWKKQQRYLQSGANLVEIDLIRGGPWVVAIPEFEMAKRKPLVVSVFNASTAKLAAYPIGLRETLPCFRVPLRASDEDVLIHLQSAIEKCYEDGRYHVALDYSQAPIPPLKENDVEWAAQLLKHAGGASLS